MLDALEAAGIATVPADARRRGYASAPLAGPPRAHRRRTDATCSSTAPTTRPERRPSRERWTTSGRTSRRRRAAPPPLTLVVASMADKDVDGIIRASHASAALRGRAYHRHADSPVARAARRPRWPSAGGCSARAPRRSRSPDPIVALVARSGGLRPDRRRRVALSRRRGRDGGWSTIRCCTIRRLEPHEPTSRMPSARTVESPAPAGRGRRGSGRGPSPGARGRS